MTFRNTTMVQDNFISRQTDLGDVYNQFIEIISDLDGQVSSEQNKVSKLEEIIDALNIELALKGEV